MEEKILEMTTIETSIKGGRRRKSTTLTHAYIDLDVELSQSHRSCHFVLHTCAVLILTYIYDLVI